MFKLILFMVVFFISNICVANEEVCLEQLKLHQKNSDVDLKNVSKMPHGYVCRAFEFSKVLDEKGDFDWWFFEEEKTIQLMNDKEARVKLYWILFKRRN